MITEQQKANLLVLANYLDALPADYAAFEMSDYFNADNYQIERNYQLHNGGVHACGAVACALGHGPAAGFLFTEKDLYSSLNRYSWSKYCERVFLTTHTEEWSWCFCPSWSWCDNTPKGAAARIRYMLDGNELNSRHEPSDYKEYLR